MINVKGRLEVVPVPCGKCPPCKKRRIDSWVFRLQQQDKVSVSSYFVTLTYNEMTVPITQNNFMTLSKRDHQLFLKRLRFLQPKPAIKYYLAGEYGTQFFRPHYHLIMFNVLDYEQIEEAWGLGTVHVDKVNASTMAYCCKYIDKPTRIPMHQRDDRVKEYSAMSKGLGLPYLTEDVYRYHIEDITRMRVRKEDGSQIPMPRYYRDKLYNDTEKAEQRKFIVSSMLEQEKRDRKKFSLIYPDSANIDYDQWKFSQKVGRWNAYQKQVNKNRDYE